MRRRLSLLFDRLSPIQLSIIRHTGQERWPSCSEVETTLSWREKRAHDDCDEMKWDHPVFSERKLRLLFRSSPAFCCVEADRRDERQPSPAPRRAEQLERSETRLGSKAFFFLSLRRRRRIFFVFPCSLASLSDSLGRVSKSFFSLSIFSLSFGGFRSRIFFALRRYAAGKRSSGERCSALPAERVS